MLAPINRPIAIRLWDASDIALEPVGPIDLIGAGSVFDVSGWNPSKKKARPQGRAFREAERY